MKVEGSAPLEEGWYLMSVDELERELRRFREPDSAPPTDAPRLSVEEALAFRDAGNVPDDLGRTLRLVLRVDTASEPGELERRRLLYEPDFHDEPVWRRAGSMPVNVVPLRARGERSASARAWHEEPRVGALEREWRATGGIAGLRVPADLRGFVFKTVLALRDAGKEVSPASVSASIARWLPRAEAARVRAELEAVNRVTEDD